MSDFKNHSSHAIRNGIMLIHGLMGSPREYGELEHTLSARGYTVRTLSLPGHGELRHKPLHAFNCDDILSHCLSEYQALLRQCDQVYVIGHSMGGICTLLTAAERPENLAGIVSLSAPYEHAYHMNRPFALFNVPIDVLFPGLFYVPEQYTGFERPEFSPWEYPKLLQEAGVMLGYLKERIRQIDVPVLLGHSPYDLTIPYDEMRKLERNLNGSPQVITHTFERCGHQIFPRTLETKNAIRRILAFIENECATGACEPDTRASAS